MEIKGYITNLSKYNEGELVGKWITFPIDEEELNEVFREIGMDYEDEEGELVKTGYEEFFFTDWETDFSNDFGEYESISRINEIAEALEAWNGEEDKFEAVCDIWDFDTAIENSPYDYNLLDDVNDNDDLGRYYAVELDCIDFGSNEVLERYFDFDAYGRDLSWELDGGFSINGWVEYVG